MVIKNSNKVANYHNNLLKGLKTVLAVVGVKSHKDLKKEHLQFVDKNGFVYSDVNRYLHTKLDS